MVVHACNSSYLEGRGREDQDPRPACPWTQSELETLSEKQNKGKRAGSSGKLLT
jgi:hypothetical protein